MKKFIVVPVALCAIGIAACGGSSPKDQVRHVATQVVAALESNHPEAYCKMTTHPSWCASQEKQAEAAGVNASSLLAKNWQSSVAHAQIKVTGNTATARFMGSHDWLTPKFAKVNGSWLMVVTPS